MNVKLEFHEKCNKISFPFFYISIGIGQQIKCQDKFEFGVVMYTSKGNNNVTEYRITESISENYKIVYEGKLSEGTYFTNFTPINKELEKLATEGWEIYNSQYNFDILYQTKKKQLKRQLLTAVLRYAGSLVHWQI